MLGRFFKNKSLVTLICALICVCVIVGFYYYRINKIIDTVEIPVAAYRLDARKEITEKDIKKVKVARSLLSSNVIMSEQKIIGKYVDYNTFIPENGMFYTSAVVEWSSMPDSAWSDISPDKTIIYLNIEEGSAYGNAIYPGDRIDLYVKTDYNVSGNDKKKVIYSKFIKSIKVLAVKDSNGRHIFEKSANSGRPAQLIFEVDEDMFLLLKTATFFHQDFEIVPVPRNAQYTVDDKAEEIKSEHIKRMILEKADMHYPDVITKEEEPNIEVVE